MMGNYIELNKVLIDTKQPTSLSFVQLITTVFDSIMLVLIYL